MDLMGHSSSTGVAPMVVLEDVGQALPTARALLTGDIDMMETTLRTDAARGAIQIITEQCPDMLVGAGAVYSVEQRRQAVEAGARFIVPPGFDPCTVDWCLEHKLTVLPGCVTPNEIMEALLQGVSTVKFFPTSIYGGLETTKALSGPPAGLQFIPTGGINAADLAEYAKTSFVQAVGGSQLCSRSDIAQGRFEHITELCRQAKNILANPQGRKNGVVQMKYLTFDEITLRLKSLGYEYLFQNETLEATLGGRKANMAVSSVDFGVGAAFLTVLPDDPVSFACMRELRRLGIDTSRILTRQGCMGTYFLGSGASQRPSKVVYDRAGSAIAQAAPSETSWGQAFTGIGWFHITGTTPALSENTMELSLRAVRETKTRDATVSRDLNYRENPWKYGKETPQVMRELTKSVDVAITNEEGVQKSLGVSAAVDVIAGQSDRKGHRVSGDQVFRESPNLRLTAITLWESVSADISGRSVCLNNGNESYTSRRYEIRDIVDRVGGGDNSTAGLIYGLTHYQNHQEALGLTVTTSCLKHSILGDFSWAGVADMEKLMAGDGSDRVQR